MAIRKEVKMIVYLARDKDGGLFMYRREPERMGSFFHIKIDDPVEMWELTQTDFPEVTWENSPQKCELKMTLMSL